MLHYLLIESENQKSGSINFLVSTHSACPYKKFCLQFFPEPQTLHYLFKFLYLVCKTRNRHTKYKNFVSKTVRWPYSAILAYLVKVVTLTTHTHVANIAGFLYKDMGDTHAALSTN